MVPKTIWDSGSQAILAFWESWQSQAILRLRKIVGVTYCHMIQGTISFFLLQSSLFALPKINISYRWYDVGLNQGKVLTGSETPDHGDITRNTDWLSSNPISFDPVTTVSLSLATISWEIYVNKHMTACNPNTSGKGIKRLDMESETPGQAEENPGEKILEEYLNNSDPYRSTSLSSIWPFSLALEHAPHLQHELLPLREDIRDILNFINSLKMSASCHMWLPSHNIQEEIFPSIYCVSFCRMIITCSRDLTPWKTTFWNYFIEEELWICMSRLSILICAWILQFSLFPHVTT